MSVASVPIFAETSFDPGTIDIMTKAYGHAYRMLHDKGQPAVVIDRAPYRGNRENGGASRSVSCQRVLTARASVRSVKASAGTMPRAGGGRATSLRCPAAGR